MSYGTPYVGLYEGIPKMSAYLNSWGHQALAGVGGLSLLPEAIESALSISREELRLHHSYDKQRVRSSFKSMLLATQRLSSEAGA